MTINKHDERGVTLLATAMLLPVIVICAGLAIDVGIAYMVRTDAQAAADATALTAAFGYYDNPADSTQQDGQDGITVGSKNLLPVQWVSGQLVKNAPPTLAQPVFGPCPFNASITCVTAVATASSPTFFAKVLGRTHVPIRASAMAEAAQASGGTYCVKPVFVPYSTISTIPAGAYPDLTIRPRDPWSTLVPGNYYSLDLTNTFNPLLFTDGTAPDTNNGANAYNDIWQHCVANPISCSTQLLINSKQGNLGNNTVTDIAQYTDTFVAPGDYDPGDRDTSSSITIMAVWDDSSQLNLNSGLTPMNIKGFVTMFIDQPPSDPKAPISAHFINYGDCTSSGAGGAGSNPPTGAPVRLVQ